MRNGIERCTIRLNMRSSGLRWPDWQAWAKKLHALGVCIQPLRGNLFGGDQ